MKGETCPQLPNVREQLIRKLVFNGRFCQKDSCQSSESYFSNCQEHQ